MNFKRSMTGKSFSVRALATLTLTLAAVAAGSALAVGYDIMQPKVTEVGPQTKSLISVFRQTEPVEVPEAVKAMSGGENRADGKTMMGLNADLARPAYPDAAHKQPPVWLVPGADEFVMSFNLDPSGHSAGGSGGSVDNEFFRNNGFVSASPGARHSNRRTQVTVLVPDSVTLVKIKTKARGKKGHIHNFTPHDNVVVANLKHTVAVIIGDYRLDLSPRRKR